MEFEKRDGAARSGIELRPIDLAAEPDFHLGGLVVRPSIRSVLTGDVETRIEPRVMQVLVALAAAGGETVSRDALVMRCWAGVTVGDDAINRAIARLRRLAGETGDTFRIETIPRVGFRLTAAAQHPAGGDALADDAAPAEENPARSSGPARARWLAAAAGAAGAVLAALTLLAFVKMQQDDGVRQPGKVLVATFASKDGDQQSEWTAISSPNGRPETLRKRC